MLLPKKTKEDRAKEKAERKKLKPLTKRAKNQKNVNSSYWMGKCDKLFMKQGHNKECIICKAKGIITTEGTCFHHHIAKSTCKALRYDLMNMMILCPTHHNFSNEMAAHSTNAYAQRAYMEFIEVNFPEKYKYCEEHQKNQTKYKYKDLYSKFKALADGGKIIERKVNET